MPYQPSDWAYSLVHQEACRIVDLHTLWDQTFYTVWLPNRDVVVRVSANDLRDLSDTTSAQSSSNIAYVAAAARISNALSQNVLLAPLSASVIPLPHQIRALSRAVAGDRVRYLLADEVGLGKTIEAGLIMRELKLRGLARRTLVIAPKGLVTQWVSEMRVHFGEDFRLLVPGDFRFNARAGWEDNLWRIHDQVVCTMDSVKPIDRRRGWSKEYVDEYNRQRFDDLISAGWDLVIVDEAHRLGGSTDQVARYKLGQGLADAAPYLLLLSATPHQGKTDSFHRLISLLDSVAFPDVESVNRGRIKPYVIRTEKRKAIDDKGNPLFQPRHTRLVPVAWEARHSQQQLLYEAVTDYVREGYNRALREKKTYVGFLMILLQRLVTSSTRAIRTTLERRLEVLQSPEEQPTSPDFSADDWPELEGEELVEILIKADPQALIRERAEVELLLHAARQTEATAPDAKAEALLEWLYRLQREEADPSLKVLIFTEFVPTQEMLSEFLADRGFSVTCLNGSMDMEERRRVQADFSKDVRILISTDAGGEGLNLQFCHIVINFDLPWNPMRIEQRIGRVDRIGQTHPVQALNFILDDTVEFRVREVLGKKLAVILSEFGVDKTGDVLDSTEVGNLFDKIYLEAILDPDAVAAKLKSVGDQLHEQIKRARNAVKALNSEEELDPAEARQLLESPVLYWLERMTISYLEATGGQVEKQGSAWNLTWPTGERLPEVVFTAHDAHMLPSARQLTLEDDRLRHLVTNIPIFVPGQPAPCIHIHGLSSNVVGFWSLWRVEATSADWSQHRVMPIFFHDNGRTFMPTARHIWDQLLSSPITFYGYAPETSAAYAFDRSYEAIQQHGKSVYDELAKAHHDRLNTERDKGNYAFAARRRAIGRIGLPAVRNHRLAQLAEEERSWCEQLAARTNLLPALVPLLLIRVDGERAHA